MNTSRSKRSANFCRYSRKLCPWSCRSASPRTGLVMNFFVLDLLSQPDRARFGWLTWLACAAPAGAITLLGAAGLLLVVFRAEILRRWRWVLSRRSQRGALVLERMKKLLSEK